MGMGELLVVLAIFMLLFGAKRLPDLADGLGKAIRNFKRGLSTPEEDVTPTQKQVSETSSAPGKLENTAPSAPAEARSAEPKS
jgi:sec-independent protein translocase protein TatA